jgi:hypothetical protein
MLDRNDLDNYITGHYGEDQFIGTDEEDGTEEETDAMPPMTPANAIECAIFELRERRAWWQSRADEDGVLPWIVERIACLEQAQRELAELREIKKALAVLRGVI